MLTINLNDIFNKMESFVDEQLKNPKSVISKVRNDILSFDTNGLD